MENFVAIDFETANDTRSSVCSVGMVVVRNGKVTDWFYSLINPFPNYYEDWATEIHGLTREDTDTAPIFPDVWEKVEPLIHGLPLVAHNKQFDEICLREVFREYQMEYPEYDFKCTLIASRQKLTLPNHQLQTVAAACGYDLTQHHHALADAGASAVIAIKIL